MIYALLAFALVICVIGWVKKWISTRAILYFYFSQGAKEPSDEQIASSVNAVIRRLFEKRGRIAP